MARIICGNDSINKICMIPEFDEKEQELLEALMIPSMGRIVRYASGELAIRGWSNIHDSEPKFWMLPPQLLPSLPPGWILNRRRDDEGYAWVCRCVLRYPNGCSWCPLNKDCEEDDK